MSDDERTSWLAWRRTGITATDAAKIAGISPWGSAWSVWAEKVGLVSDDNPPSQAAEFGKRAEKLLAQWFTDRTGLYVRGEQMWCTHPTEPWMLATVDGFACESPAADTADAIGGTEIKTTTDSVKAWRGDGPPLHYQAQCQWQMAVTGMPVTYLPTLHLGFSTEFEVHEVPRDEDDIRLLTDLARTFWHDHVLTGVPPDTDGSDATATALRHAWPNPADDAVEADDELAGTVANLLIAKADAKEIAAAIAELENRVKAAIGDHQALVHGVDAKGRPQVIATWKWQDRAGFDHEQALQRYPRALTKFKTNTPVRVLRPKKIKETT